MCQHAVMTACPHAVMMAYAGHRTGSRPRQHRILPAGSVGDARLSVFAEQIVDGLDDELLAGPVLFRGQEP